MRRKKTRRIRYRPGNAPRLRMPRLSLPIRRRRRRYRVVNRRRLIIAQAVLAVIAVSALALSASVIVRSVRTVRLNKALAAMHTVAGEAPAVEIAAPPIESGESSKKAAPRTPYGELSAMVMPDGSPIVVPAAAASASEKTSFHRTDLDILPDMLKLSRKNPDTVGWIRIAGVVQLPVVYRDNAYYLDHDFTGAKNASGTLFLDESSPISGETQNLLVHGHAMKDGTMFGILTHYRRLDFLKQHPLISFSTLWEKETYAVFAVLQVSPKPGDENYFNFFNHPTFTSDAAFDDYVSSLVSRSKFSIPVEVQPTDALLTLSTCLDDDRLVVVARRLRPGETKDAMAAAV